MLSVVFGTLKAPQCYCYYDSDLRELGKQNLNHLCIYTRSKLNSMQINVSSRKHDWGVSKPVLMVPFECSPLEFPCPWIPRGIQCPWIPIGRGLTSVRDCTPHELEGYGLSLIPLLSSWWGWMGRCCTHHPPMGQTVMEVLEDILPPVLICTHPKNKHPPILCSFSGI